MRRRAGKGESRNAQSRSPDVDASPNSERTRPATSKPTKRRIGVYEVEELNQTFWDGFIPTVSLKRWVEGVRTGLPFLWRLVVDLAKSGGYSAILFWVFGKALASLLPAYELWISSKLFDLVQESIDFRQIRDYHYFALIAFLRVFCAIVERFLRWSITYGENMLSERVWKLFAPRVLAAKLRLPLQTMQDPDSQRLFAQIASVVGEDGPGRSGRANGLARGLSGFFGFVEVATQGAVLYSLLKDRPDERIYAFVAILSYLLTRIEFSHRGKFLWCNMVDSNFLRMFFLGRLGDVQYKAEVQALGAEDYILSNYLEAQKDLGPTSILHPRLLDDQRFSLVGCLRDALSYFPMIHLSLRAARTDSSIPLSLATVTLINQTTSKFATKMERVVKAGEGLADDLQSFRDLYQLDELEADLPDGTLSLERKEDRGMSVEFDRVSYSYPGSSSDSIREISFRIDPGQLIVVCGRNGGGKSTMIKLLARLLDPSSGTVRINSQDVRDYRLSELRAAVVVQFQDYTHFPLTVAENISLGDTTSPFSQDSVEAAAKLGGAHEFINNFPMGYDTTLAPPNVGSGRTKNRGGSSSLQQSLKRAENEKTREIKLSGGQWQRLALSRTLMRINVADLLIFDEPSSSLDPKAEYELFERLDSIRQGRTAVFITHRFGQVNKKADMILHIQEGKIIERGTHDSLMAMNGPYAEMHQQQASAFVNSTA